MSEAELNTMWRRLGRLNRSQLIEAFRRVHENCRAPGERMPGAEAMRELIMIWHLAHAWEEREDREQERLAAVA
ncbi:MAG TPA: hypothetical protein VFT60_11615 [Bryobacteraceae bacterium]|jgi:hypothetical protein|nr:hypothetical protein [Bryobacteraceae bacterium]